MSKYICIKNLVMDDPDKTIEATKGYIYNVVGQGRHGHYTFKNNSGDTAHAMSEAHMQKYFVKILGTKK